MTWQKITEILSEDQGRSVLKNCYLKPFQLVSLSYHCPKRSERCGCDLKKKRRPLQDSCSQRGGIGFLHRGEEYVQIKRRTEDFEDGKVVLALAAERL